jgi:putative methionine-R-sulfoxide reductase with GAF domain
LRYRLFRFADPLNQTLMGSPYTNVGRIAAGMCALYLALMLVAGWRYRRQIAAPLVVVPVMGLGVIQALTIISSTLRELALAGAVGGVASLVLAYHLIENLGFDPGTSQARWMKTIGAVSRVISDTRQFEQTLTDLAALARRLTHAGAVTILRAVDTNQFEIVAMAGEDTALLGRTIRGGEGLTGRVMQTLSPMRIDDYDIWNGRITALDDVPIHAMVSVPLIYNGKLVGAINAHETAPGRVFIDREQAILEWLAPQAAITLAAHRLDHDLNTARAYLQSVMDDRRAAVMIFDSTGKLCESNTASQRVLRILVDDATDSILVTRIVEQAQNEHLTHALARWMSDPASTPSLEVDFPSIGRLIVDLRTIRLERSGPGLLMIMREPCEAAR